MKRDSNEKGAMCEKCGTEISREAMTRLVLDDGQLHAFCEDCVEHLLIIKDGSLRL